MRPDEQAALLVDAFVLLWNWALPVLGAALVGILRSCGREWWRTASRTARTGVVVASFVSFWGLAAYVFGVHHRAMCDGHQKLLGGSLICGRRLDWSVRSVCIYIVAPCALAWVAAQAPYHRMRSTPTRWLLSGGIVIGVATATLVSIAMTADAAREYEPAAHGGLPPDIPVTCDRVLKRADCKARSDCAYGTVRGCFAKL
jgi:hypothetical protein